MRYFYFLLVFVVSAVIGNYQAFGCGGDDNNNGGSGNYINDSATTFGCGGDDNNNGGSGN